MNRSTPAATDVVLVRDLSITPQSIDVINRDVVRPYLEHLNLLQTPELSVRFE